MSQRQDGRELSFIPVSQPPAGGGPQVPWLPGSRRRCCARKQRDMRHTRTRSARMPMLSWTRPSLSQTGASLSLTLEAPHVGYTSFYLLTGSTRSVNSVQYIYIYIYRYIHFFANMSGSAYDIHSVRPKPRMTFIRPGRSRVWHLCEVALNLATAV